MKKFINENLFEKYKVDNFELFLKRKDESMKFSQFSNAQSQIVYMLLDNELKDFFTSFITSRKSSWKQSSNIFDESVIDKNVVIDEDIIDKNVVTSKDIIDKNVVTSKNIIDKNVVTSKDVIDENIVTNKNIIDKDIVTSKNIIDKDIITNRNAIEKIIIKEIDTKRSKRDQINDCDSREFDEFWKKNL